MIASLLRITSLALLLTACASTETTNSSGEKSQASIDQVFTEADKTGPLGAATTTDSTTSLAGIDQQSFENFEAYKAWQKARQPDSPEFYEFKLWLEYLEFLRVTNN